MKKVAVLQSNYLPWKGYFDIINDVDLFIFYDEVQYTKNDWRNRNKIYTQHGLKWLTLPCGYDLKRKISEVKFKNQEFGVNHWNIIRNNYEKAPFFKLYKDFFEYVYMEREWVYLSDLNQYLIKEISRRFLNIKTEFADSCEFDSHGLKNEKLLSLLKNAKAETYVSGPAAKDYMKIEDYLDNGIKIIWKNYEGYPSYKQIYDPFEQGVSIIDMLFNLGEDTPYYIWGWRGRRALDE